MELSTLLEKNKPAVLKKWLGAIFDTYPADTSLFLKGEQDRFANPVGHIITDNAEHILTGLIMGTDARSLSEFLEQIIRIRAVQDFTPTEAVSFMDSLKPVIAGQIKTQISQYNLGHDWAEFASQIDVLTQCANELHAEMKKRIDIIRAGEMEKSERSVKRLMGCCKE